jgi:hypothetical protein
MRRKDTGGILPLRSGAGRRQPLAWDAGGAGWRGRRALSVGWLCAGRRRLRLDGAPGWQAWARAGRGARGVARGAWRAGRGARGGKAGISGKTGVWWPRIGEELGYGEGPVDYGPPGFPKAGMFPNDLGCSLWLWLVSLVGWARHLGLAERGSRYILLVTTKVPVRIAWDV